jgi:hypothetical protein
MLLLLLLLLPLPVGVITGANAFKLWRRHMRADLSDPLPTPPNPAITWPPQHSCLSIPLRERPMSWESLHMQPAVQEPKTCPPVSNLFSCPCVPLRSPPGEDRYKERNHLIPSSSAPNRQAHIIAIHIRPCTQGRSIGCARTSPGLAGPVLHIVALPELGAGQDTTLA